MLSAKTCLILGAGASCEVGLPLGTELLGEIRVRAERDVSNRDIFSPAPGGLLSLVSRTNDRDRARRLAAFVNRFPFLMSNNLLSTNGFQLATPSSGVAAAMRGS